MVQVHVLCGRLDQGRDPLVELTMALLVVSLNMVLCGLRDRCQLRVKTQMQCYV